MLFISVRQVHLHVHWFVGVPEFYPRIIVMGAEGRCGKGAIEMAEKLGIPRYFIGHIRIEKWLEQSVWT